MGDEERNVLDVWCHLRATSEHIPNHPVIIITSLHIFRGSNKVHTVVENRHITNV